MEGASVPKYSRALALFREDPKTYYALAEKLTAAVTAYLQMQIATGVDAVQLFDSHGGHLLPTEFQEASGRWMKEIIAAIGAPSTASASSVGVQALACSGDTLKRELQPGAPIAAMISFIQRPLAS